MKSIYSGHLPDEFGFLGDTAFSHGAVAVGVAAAKKIPEQIFQSYLSWVSSSRSGELNYLNDRMDVRRNPGHEGIVADAAVVVSIAFPYGNGAVDSGIWQYVASYARGRDYHKTIRTKLKAIGKDIKRRFINANWRVFVDSVPVLERTWAVLAGIGSIGKNGMLIVPDIGTRVLLGEIVLSNVPGVGKDILETELNTFPLCGTCTRCIEACPTGALTGDGSLNVPRCLSYISIEKRSHTVPEDVSEKMKLIFGCDECVTCCPQNPEVQTVITPPAEKNPAPSLEAMVEMDEETLRHRLKGTCLFRTGATQLKENGRRVLRNLNSKIKIT